MPPASEPVVLTIAEEIRSTLAAIVEGSSYFFTYKSVELTQGDGVKEVSFPCILVAPLSSRQDGDLNYADTFRQDFVAQVVFESIPRGEAHKYLARAAHDVHKALKANPQRNNLAVDTIWQGHIPSIPTDDADPLATVECQFQVYFRTSNRDMTQPI